MDGKGNDVAKRETILILVICGMLINKVGLDDIIKNF
jgi:hypothetical protein